MQLQQKSAERCHSRVTWYNSGSEVNLWSPNCTEKELLSVENDGSRNWIAFKPEPIRPHNVSGLLQVHKTLSRRTPTVQNSLLLLT